MGLLLRTTEDSRPLFNNSVDHITPVESPAAALISWSTLNIAVADDVHDPDTIISSKFGDSCRKSLTSVFDKGCTNTFEIEFKRNLLRETSSGECFFYIVFEYVCMLFRINIV